MLNFKNLLNLKIISIILAQMFLCASLGYPSDVLRVPMASGSKTTQRLKTGADQTTGSIEYVSSPGLLKLSNNPEIKKAWDATVMHHLVLYEFAREFSRLTRKKGLICNFGKGDFRKLSSYVDFRRQHSKDLIYNIGFIAWNSKIENMPLFRFNLVMFVAMQRTGLAPELMLNKKNREVATAFSKEPFFRQLFIDFIRSYAYDHDYAKVGNILEISRELFLEKLDLNGKTTKPLFREILFLLRRVFSENKIPFEKMINLEKAPDHAVLLNGYESLFGYKIFDYLRKAKPVFRSDIAGQERDYKTIDTGSYFFQGPSLFGEARGKIRRFTLPNGQEFYIKRIDPLRVSFPEEEIVVSQRAEKALQVGDKRYYAQKFVGIIHYEGALYLLSLGIKGNITIREKDIKKIQRILTKAGIPNPSGMQREKELIEDQDGNIHVFDFETFPYHGEKAAVEINEAVSSYL